MFDDDAGSEADSPRKGIAPVAPADVDQATRAIAERPPRNVRLDTAGCHLPVVARWNLHAGRQYEEAQADYFPFDRLVEEDLASRRALAALARLAADLARDVSITVNNKAEGSAPLSVARLAAAITAHEAT